MRTILESTMVPPAHIDEVTPRSERDDALFAELTTVLDKHNALDRFGVTLLHRHFSIAPGEVLLETTKDEARVHTLEPVRDIQSSDQFIETSWRLGDGIVAVVSACRNDGDNGHFPV